MNDLNGSAAAGGKSVGREGLVLPVLVLGLGNAVAVWIAAFVAHLPWIDWPQRVAGPAVLIVWLMGAIVSGRWMALRGTMSLGRLMAAGTGGGVVCALLGLMILGALLVEPGGEGAGSGSSGLRPGAGLIAGGFIALGAAIGCIGALVGSVLAGRRLAGGPMERGDRGTEETARGRLAQLAWVVAFSVLPLIVVGGGVTSTNSGMAIIGWPDSYGANMFLYPISLMTEHPQRFFEHSHRLFGTLVGLCTIVLAICVCVWRRERSLWIFSALLVGMVIVQGLLGAQRVLLGADAEQAAASRDWGLMHGVLAQIFLACVVALAARLSQSYEKQSVGTGAEGNAAGARRMLPTALLGALLIQLTLGAMFRHSEKQAMHALWTHIGFSIVVVVLATLTGISLSRIAQREGFEPGVRKILRRVGMSLIHATGLQFVLGFGALAAVLMHGDKSVPVGDEILAATQVPIWQGIVRTIHQANGALLLALATLAWVWMRRARGAR